MTLLGVRSRVKLTAVVLSVLVQGMDRPGAASAQEQTHSRVEADAVAHAERLDRTGREQEALSVLEDLLRRQPTSVQGLIALSRIAERRGSPARVLPWIEGALAAESVNRVQVRRLWIHALRAAGYADSAANVARHWVETEPTEQAAYAELAALLVSQADTVGAIGALEQGRAALGPDRPYVQELAALYAGARRYAEAAEEWCAMLSWGRAGIEAVDRRIRGLDTERPRALSALRKRLAAQAVSEIELRGGVVLALELGEPEWGRELVHHLLVRLPEAGASELLHDYVDRARRAGDLGEAAWAAGQLADRTDSAPDHAYWTAVSADLSYELGDAASAARAFERVYATAEPGSEAHRLSIRRLHSLLAPGDAKRAEELLREYQVRYANDEEASAQMVLQTASAWMEAGELKRSGALLEELHGGTPSLSARRAALLGRIALMEGDLAAARGQFERAAAVSGSDSGIRIGAIRWLALLGTADSAATVRLGRGIVAAARGDPVPLVESAQAWMDRDTEGGSLIVSLAAAELDALGFEDDGGRIRLELVQRWPRSPEAPEALLELARGAAPEQPRKALAWLERLIIEYPTSALAPVARRELAVLEASVPEA